jgi:hypothetical protein
MTDDVLLDGDALVARLIAETARAQAAERLLVRACGHVVALLAGWEGSHCAKPEPCGECLVCRARAFLEEVWT